MAEFWFEQAYLADGWADSVLIKVGAQGRIEQVQSNVEPAQAEVFRGWAMPGFANIHSHAFQRAMAGLSEVATSPSDSFWTWRKVMYQFAHALNPEDLEAIASQLYMEMLKAGYTSVAEFHYLHNQACGESFVPIEAMSNAIANAAETTGLGLSLLPVLYMTAGFGNKPLEDHQRRFGHKLESYERLLVAVQQRFKGNSNMRMGMALHSLRAVPGAAMSEAVALLNSLDNSAPIHIHIAEQTLEVEDCLKHTGKRPVEWLLENQSLDPRWCLIHATHINQAEVKGMAERGVVAGLCPTTEANLGDGFFPMAEFLAQGGHFAVGSDSNTSINPIEELRWLEYGQRLLQQQRNIVSDSAITHTGEKLVRGSMVGGELALARSSGELAVGKMADIVVLDNQQANLFNKPKPYRLDALLFSGNDQLVSDVIVAGKQQVFKGQHLLQQEISENYQKVLTKLHALL